MYVYYDSKESVLLLKISKTKTYKITVGVAVYMIVNPGLSHDGMDVDKEVVRERGAVDGTRSWI